MQPTEPQPPQTPPDDLRFRNLVDELSSRLRHLYARDEVGAIEQLAQDAPAEFQDRVFEELVIEEARVRRANGEILNAEDYRQRFPDKAMLVKRIWHKVEHFPLDSTAKLNQDPSDAFFSEASTDLSPKMVTPDEPTQFGPYKVLRGLGAGTFGSVYKAEHESTSKIVAVKILKTEWANDPECGTQMRQQFADEAKMMLQFDHPNVVKVISLDDRADPPYFVQEYIDGETLANRLKTSRPSLGQALQFAIQIAAGLAHIHSRERWHRDLKPANILLDRNDHVYLADFGLALDDAQRWSSSRGPAGTYPYMAPEQIKGATHRLNARCDIWALGVILYEMLTGRRPFRGETRDQLCDEILERTPPAPRELDRSIPRELNRLVMRCLSKRDADRPDAAADLQDDLVQILERLDASSSSASTGSSTSTSGEATADSTKPAQTIEYPIPTLKRFTAEQAALYLRLMPRSYTNQDELPELIAYWKQRILERDPDKTFSVGIMVGVSGCGKSSMLEAGLVPALPDSIVPILIEASESDTEARILSKLYRAIPDADPEKKWSLVDWAFRLRNGSLLPRDTKVVFILDQFEQWLNAHGGEASNQLLDALHQCDGEHLQAIVCVREGFHATLMRFVDLLEIVLDADENYATAHRFKPDRARYVLTQFGRGLKRLNDPLTEDQQAFIDATVEGLAESDRGVVCVRLVVLALVMQDRPWTVAELDNLGGLEGIGSQFLTDCFEGRTASEQYRRYLPAAMRVLAELLPAEGLEIKDVRSYDRLLAASELDKLQFDDLLNILTRKLFLLTIVEAERTFGDNRFAPETIGDNRSTLYQLTHDFLVPSIREWLARKLRETKEGRALLRLQERTSAWTSKPENRNLPSLWEWLTIRRLTDRQKWKLNEKTVMRRAGLVHATRTGFVAATLALVTLGGMQFNSHLKNQQLDLQATNLVELLAQADFANLDGILADLEPLRERATYKLTAAFDAQTEGSDAQLKLAIGLMADDPNMLEKASRRLLDIPSAKFTPIRDLLFPYKEQIVPKFWQRAGDADLPTATRFQAACALATFDPAAAQWDDAEFTSLITEHLVGVLPSDLPVWQQALSPVREKLVPGLANIFRDTNRREQERSFATDTLKTYAAGDPAMLASLVCDADTDGFNTLFPVLAAEGPRANERLTDVLKQTLTHDWQDAPLDPSWTQPSATAKAALETNGGLLETRFALVQTLPWDRFDELATELSKSGFRPTRVRPYEQDGEKLVAAVWQRDGWRWELQQDLSLTDLPDAQQPAIRNGLLPCDLAVQQIDDQGQPRFCLLWGQANDEAEQRRVVADLTAARLADFEVTTGFYTSPFEGFLSQSTVTVWTDSDGTRHYGGIWSSQGAVAEINLGFDGEEYFDQPQWDIALGDEPAVTNPLVRQQSILTQIDGLPAEARLQPRAGFDRATALFHVGRVEGGKQQLDAFLTDEANAANPDLHRLHAWTLARLGDADAARESLAKHLETVSDPIMRAYASAPLEAYLGNHEAAKQQLSDATAKAAGDADQLYNIVCAAALSSLPASSQESSLPDEPATADADPAEESAPKDASSEDQRAEYRDVALKLLEQTIAAGYDNGAQMSTDIDLAALHDDEKFQQIVQSLLPSRRVVGLWRSDVGYESRLVQASSVDGLLERVKPLIATGYRPFSLVVDKANSILTLHRPLIPDAEKEQLAIRQASAAAALLRMGEAEQVWPLFQHTNDLRVRSYLLSRLTGSQVDPALILDRLQNESDPASRHAMILAIGEYAAADLLSTEQRATALQWLKASYADDPAPGVHGASEWALRQLGERDAIDEIRTAYATGKPVGDRRWYLTQTVSPSEQTDPPESQRTQPLSMALIDATEPFLMGTPVSEAERFGGPTGKNEIRHLRTIGYRYAIGMHEVSVAQFKQFRPRHDFNRTYARESDAPANVITWYDAAAYCNWLSEQEGIPRDQWCYAPDQPFAEGMVLPADHLKRTGYRLATEAEWEHACRAGTSTSRFYGETEGLLGEYGWYTKNSGDRNMLSVGAQKPNPLGLFALQGNALEWCVDRAVLYDKGQLGNQVNLGKIDNAGSRVLRGGSFNSYASDLRSGGRTNSRPDNRVIVNGFRLSRTYP